MELKDGVNMESKAQKAAMTRVEELIGRIKTSILSTYQMRCNMTEIETTIEKYQLNNKMDIINRVYDILMKKEFHTIAADLAKKYNL